VRRRGRLYYYHRKTGERLPEDAAARALRVLAINATLEPRRSPAGSIDALATAFKSSAEWKALAPKTRYEYGRHLDAIGTVLGRFPARAVERRHALELRDGLAEKPREANYRTQVFHRLMAFGLDRGILAANPISDIKKLKEGEGFQAWPPHVWTAAVAHPLAYAELVDAWFLIRYSGQRPQDAVAMPKVHLAGGRMHLRQLKTGKRLSLRMPAPLAERLGGRKGPSLLVLATRDGTPWTVDYLAKETRKVMEAIGEAGKGYTPHGLRHLAGDELAEAGASAKEIAAVLRHATLAMVQRYTSSADQQRLADAAAAKLHGTDRDRSLQNRHRQTAKRRKAVAK